MSMSREIKDRNMSLTRVSTPQNSGIRRPLEKGPTTRRREQAKKSANTFMLSLEEYPSEYSIQGNDEDKN